MKYEIKNKWTLVYQDLIILISEYFVDIIIETDNEIEVFDIEEEMIIFITEHHLVKENIDPFPFFIENL